MWISDLRAADLSQMNTDQKKQERQIKKRKKERFDLIRGA